VPVSDAALKTVRKDNYSRIPQDEMNTIFDILAAVA